MLKPLAVFIMSFQSVLIIRELSLQSIKFDLEQLIKQPVYIIQLLATTALILSIILLLNDKGIWWISSAVGIILTQFIVISSWQSMKLLIIPNIIILVVVIVGYFTWSFNSQIMSETSQIIKNYDYSSDLVKAEDLNSLPSPIKRWLENSNIIGKEYIRMVYLEQKGHLRLEPDQKWIESKAKQYFLVDQPSFIWSVKTEMNNIPILGRDLYYEGKGEMLIKLASIIPVVNEKDNKKLSEATLQRYLGEIVWFPSAALSDYIVWQEIDDYSAKAIMTYEGVSGEATFYFNKDYDLVKFLADRYKDVDDDKRTLWQAKVIEIGEFNGIRMPIKLEASWLPQNEEEFMWYQFEVTKIKYNEKVPIS